MAKTLKIGDTCYKLGWVRDLPDCRDYTVASKELENTKELLSSHHPKSNADLRKWCAPIEDQGDLGSCTANAAVGMLEYYENRRFGKFLDASRLFIYKCSRNLLGLEGDTGSSIRATMAALVLFGAPPEEYWPYDIQMFDAEPSAFCYAFAQNYQTLRYFRLDPIGLSKKSVLLTIKRLLSRGIPAMFGFSVYSSIRQASRNGKIMVPTRSDRLAGGHAVMAVGYDDNMEISNGESVSKGALLIRNSWGTSWGQDGYGWLPYEYVLTELAVDWWSILKSEWVDLTKFTD